jgi:acyl-CoA synthetase (AMP-forming)/AMP-acid ligase II
MLPSPSEQTAIGRGMTMSDILARHARTNPPGVAFRDGVVTRTWAQADERVANLANVLTNLGVATRDRVAVLGFNSSRLLDAMAATVRLRAICVPVNFRPSPTRPIKEFDTIRTWHTSSWPISLLAAVVDVVPLAGLLWRSAMHSVRDGAPALTPGKARS